MRYRRLVEAVKDRFIPEKTKTEDVKDPTMLVISTPSLLRTIQLIRDYLNERNQRGFTYNGIKAYAAKVGFYREYSDRTLDRSIRRLVELGVLGRYEKEVEKNGRRVSLVIFFPTEIFWRVVKNAGSGAT